jgi:glycosyltransferase involved in cell wall biosynthesis
MRVCFVSPSYFPTIGGTEVAIYELGKRLVNKGCEVISVTPTPNGVQKIVDDSGMLVYRIPIPFELPILSPRHLYGRLFPPPITSTYALIKILKTNKLGQIDILHQFHVFYLGAASVLAKKLLGKRLVTSLMGWDIYDPIHPLPKLLNPYLAHILNNSDMIVSPAKQLLSYVRQICKRKIRIIPHGVDVARFNANIHQNDYKVKLGLKKDEVLALSVQRLAPRKGVENLLYAMSIVVKENSKVKLAIIGDGSEKARLIELTKKLGINKNVTFMGFVDFDDLPKYYSTCDIFVLHSLYELFGIVLVEAMACGKPVISTKVGAIPEIVDHGKTGFLVEPKNPKQLAEAILKLASDEKLRNKLGSEGRRKAREKYDWDIIVDKYLHEYEQIIKQ